MAKRRTKAELEAEIVKISAQSDANYESGREWKALAAEREKKIAEVREQFADLKRRLLEAEVENARLKGYMARVHEGDIARDGHVDIQEGGEVRTVPKWPSQQQVVHQSDFRDFADVRDHYGNKVKRTHWTAY